MLRELKFVQGAVAKKDLLPAMTHFAIEKGTVRSYNGTVALSAPLAFDIDCKPKADKLVQAIANCPAEAPIALSMTKAGRLKIEAGNFSAFVECVMEETPHVLPEGERIDLDGEKILKALRIIHPFIGDDASRVWSNGVLFKGESAYATNNVMLVEYWTGARTPIEVNVPRAAIREMLRINEPPTYAQVTPTSMTFHYEDRRWIRTQLLAVNWPDLDSLLNRTVDVVPLNQDLFDGLERLKPFADKMGRVYLREGLISTQADSTDEGAFFKLPDFPYTGVYQIEMLSLLKGVATHIDWGSYPNPGLFYGDQLRGALVGIRL